MQDLFSLQAAQPFFSVRASHRRGSGPTLGLTVQTTTGIAASGTSEHPPTSTMNRASGNAAASSEDAQKQTQGQPTAAQEAQGAKAKAGANNDC